jgi:hypothetical protein
MKRDEFIKSTEEALELLMDTLKYKGKEYSTVDNTFANFENAIGTSMCDTREGVLWHYMLKHVVSIKDMVQELEVGGQFSKNYTEEYVNEKIGDNINYLLLLRAMLLERLQTNNTITYDTGSY